MRVEENKSEDGRLTRYLRSAADRLERLEDYDESGQLTMTVDYQYDDGGRNTERIVRRADGKQLRRLTFEFQDSMKGAVHREYDENDTLVFTRSGKNAR